jgi:hypothetical protein
MTQYTLTKCRAVFTRCGYAVQLLNDDGTSYMRLLNTGVPYRWFPDSGPVHFFGNDGRKVRSEAIAFVKAYDATPAAESEP